MLSAPIKREQWMKGLYVVHRGCLFLGGPGIPKGGNPMIRKFQRHIETSNWDEIIIDGDDRLVTFCQIIITLAVVYFGGWILASFM
jgi:hypothetical protein